MDLLRFQQIHFFVFSHDLRRRSNAARPRRCMRMLAAGRKRTQRQKPERSQHNRRCS